MNRLASVIRGRRASTPFIKVRGLLALAMLGLPLMLAAQTQQSVPPRLSTGQLAVGDDVVVMIFQERDLSARVYVDSRNQIVLPRIGSIDVSGLTTETLRDTIRARYSTFLRDPSIDVQALRRVTVNGAVPRPNVYFVDPTLTLRDVLAMAGGVTNEGNAKRVSIIRDGQTTTYPKWRDTDDGLTQLRSGDQILVGQRSWFALNAGVLLGTASILTSLAIAFLR